MAAGLPYKGRHPLEIASLTLYAVLFAWISAGFWTAVFGFFVLLFKRDNYSISATVDADTPLAPGRNTAILVPVTHEDGPRGFAGIRATYKSTQRPWVRDSSVFFVPSDNRPATARRPEI